MNRCFWKFAGTVLCGAAALLTLSGCWSRSTQPTDQTYSTTATTYAGQPSAQAGGSVSMSHAAPVYQSDSQWQAGYAPVYQRRQINESAGAEVETQSNQSQSQNLAPVQSSDSQWERVESPRAQNSGNTYVEPSANQSNWHAEHRTHRTSEWQASANSEGPNSGGKWQRGAGQETLGPAASSANGWLPGYSNPNYAHQQGTIHEASGSYSHDSFGRDAELQQQLDRQQQQINQQQHELNQLRHQLHQQSQPAESNNSTP